MKTETYKNIGIIQWQPNKAVIHSVWHATDLDDALAVMRGRHPDKNMCAIYTRSELEEHIQATYGIKRSAILERAELPSDALQSLSQEEIESMPWCSAFYQMPIHQKIYVLDDKLYPKGKICPIGEKENMKYQCLQAWLNDDSGRGVICRELNSAEIDKIFSDERNLPECFSKYDRKDPEEEAEHREKSQELIKSSLGKLFISEDDMIFVFRYGFTKDNYKKIEGRKLPCIKYSEPIILELATA